MSQCISIESCDKCVFNIAIKVKETKTIVHYCSLKEYIGELTTVIKQENIKSCPLPITVNKM